MPCPYRLNWIVFNICGKESYISLKRFYRFSVVGPNWNLENLVSVESEKATNRRGSNQQETQRGCFGWKMIKTCWYIPNDIDLCAKGTACGTECRRACRATPPPPHPPACEIIFYRIKFLGMLKAQLISAVMKVFVVTKTLALLWRMSPMDSSELICVVFEMIHES